MNAGPAATAARASLLRSHALSAVRANLSSAAVAVLAVLMLRHALGGVALLGWASALALTLALRLLVARVHQRAGLPNERGWLYAYRAGTLLHGLVWGSLGLLVGAGATHTDLGILALLLAGMTAGAMTMALFDLPTVALFAVPALLPVTLRLLGGSEPAPPLVIVAGALIALLTVFFVVLAQRVQRERLELAAARISETEGHAEARRSQALLRLLFDHAGEGISVFDAELRLVAWNERFLDFSGLDPALARVGMPLREGLLSLARAGEWGPADEAVAAAQAAHQLALLSRPEGSVSQRLRPDGRTIETRRSPTPGGGFVLVCVDASARRQAEQRLQQAGEQLAQKSHVLEVTLESLAQGVLTADAEGRIVSYNRRLLELLDLPQTLLERQPAMHELQALQIEHGHQRRADGTVLDVHTYAAAGGGWVRTYSDITVQLRAEAALIAAKTEAERANRAKSEFLSRMSHELRTPMNAILGFGQLLENDADNPLTPTQRSRVKELLRGGRHLLGLINEVLDLARIESGTLQLNLEPVDVPALLNGCLRLVQPVAEQRAVALEVHAPAADCFVLADRKRLEQVVLNLLSNAIKYNRAGGHVRIRTRFDGGEHVRIEVSDSGPGISAQQQTRLFQAFERLGADRSTVEGAGIGLALSKWLVNLMQGEIGVDSEPGRGSTFWVRLARTSRAPSPGAPSQPMPLDGPAGDVERTVLYIEDNPVNQLLMQGMLARRPGIRLMMADRAFTGLELAAACAPDLVLLDIQLPEMDGFEVLRRLRASPATRDVPVVAVSANAMPSDVEQAERAGFSEYLTKPLDMKRLLEMIDRRLGQTA